MDPRERPKLVLIIPFGQREYENNEPYDVQEKRNQIVVLNHVTDYFVSPQEKQLVLQLSYVKIVNTEKEEIPS